jgi:hypothetical protein
MRLCVLRLTGWYGRVGGSLCHVSEIKRLVVESGVFSLTGFPSDYYYKTVRQ